MIAYMKGTIDSVQKDGVVLECNNIGYTIFMSNAMALTTQEVKLYIYEHIREDAHILFGFLSKEEQGVFERLITVKGVGPKIAMNVLRVGGYQKIIQAIESEDATFLKTLPGIGNKAASQIVLDLKGKLIVQEPSEHQALENDATLALKSLGYKPSELAFVQKKLKDEDLSVDEYIKKALALLMKQKGG